MNTVLTLDPPAPLMSMNDRQRPKAQQAASWRRRAEVAALEQLGPQRHRIERPACTIAIALPVRDRRRRDPANYFTTVKHIVDGLVDAGVWPDDTPEFVTTTEPTLVVGATKVTITLIPRGDRSCG